MLPCDGVKSAPFLKQSCRACNRRRQVLHPSAASEGKQTWGDAGRGSSADLKPMAGGSPESTVAVRRSCPWSSSLLLHPSQPALALNPFLDTSRRRRSKASWDKGGICLMVSVYYTWPCPCLRTGASRDKPHVEGPVFNVGPGGRHLRVQWCVLLPLVTLTVPGASL